MSTQKITVVIADDHPIVLLGVRELIERDERFQVVGEAVSSSELIKVLSEREPDILITDYNMPESSVYGDGLKLVKYLVRHYPALQILVLTMVSNSLILSRLYDLGVAGVVQKNQLHAEIQKALDALSLKRRYKSPEMKRVSVKDDGRQVDERLALLSIRELEILRLFVSGMSLRDIAVDQNRSAKTISTQKVAAMRKLEVNSDQELIAYCLEANLFQ
ncbi:response regulator [Pseudomonas sp. C2B4]|uniref:response regulator n=1 Tax=Pseudomonas sp. C2B4 TaxID=2735270 RepID=UPI001586912C|nr:response regulator [Pseudomonas sp. C2B4]NUU38421.1 response regulator [Pseudomonas sp. C2B4]